MERTTPPLFGGCRERMSVQGSPRGEAPRFKKEQFPEVAREEGKCPVSNAYRGSMQIELDAKAV